ncbi:MAG: nitroreductase/quinone reductase family protein, partial [Aquihabitans sp.]
MFSVDGPMSRAVRKVATSKSFRKVAPTVLPPVDRALHRVSGGRLNLSGLIVPSLVLTTIGQKSGLPRESPLACVPDGELGWFVVGSNFGQQKHPAWTGNLLAHPEASVAYKKRTYSVIAHPLTDDQ